MNGFSMHRRSARAVLGLAITTTLAVSAASLTGCVVEPTRPVVVQPAMDPHQMAIRRFDQVAQRVDKMHHRIEHNAAVGFYPPPIAGDLHHHVDAVFHEAQDMASSHGGGLSGGEQRRLNAQLDDIGERIR